MTNEKVQCTDVMAGTHWQHRNGNKYEVLFLANVGAENDDANDYETTVVYRGENGKLWTRPLSDWSRSMTIKPCRNYECRRIIAEQQATIEALRRTAAATPSPQADKARVPDGLIEALRNQRQVDEEGIECGVSRQAVDEAIEILESLTVPADKARGEVVAWCDAFDRDVMKWGDHYLASRLAEASRQLRVYATPQPQGDAASQVREFHPAFDMPTTPAEAIAMLVEWGDPLCMTFDVKKAKRAAELLTPQARPDGDLYDTIFAAVKKGCPKCGDAHDNPERPVLNFRELEAIAGAVFAAVFPLVQARPDGGAVAWMADDGSTVSEYARAAHPSPTAFAEYTTPLYTHPAPAPDVARLVELLNAIDADVLAAEQIGERVTHDDIRTCVSQLRAAAQQGATNGQE